MSWWVGLENEDGQLLSVDSFEEGGTYVMGGSTEADLNITYNYSPHYYAHLNSEEGLRWLDEKQAKETIPAIKGAINALGTDEADDYWEPTEGNARRALTVLLKWAEQRPSGKWSVS